MTFSRTSPDHAHLIGMRSVRACPGGVTAVCLVMHGGRSQSQAEVFAGQLAVLRMRPIARAVATARPDLAVYRLQLAVRGWNGTGFTAVRDARWAVHTLRERHPDRPVVLVGHSMGARTALRIADEPGVVGVVGLAAWLPPDEPLAQLRDVGVRLVHGDRDRIVPEPSTRPLLARMLTAGVDVRRTVLTGTGHGMVRDWRRWNAATVAAVGALLGGATSGATGPAKPADGAGRVGSCER